MKDLKVSQEVASDQLDIFFDYYDIEISSGTEEQKEALGRARNKLSRAIQKGRLTITNEKGLTVIQTLVTPLGKNTTVQYKKMSGQAKLNMKDNGGEYNRMYSLLAFLAGLPLNAIAKFEGVDLSTAEYLAVLFLAI